MKLSTTVIILTFVSVTLSQCKKADNETETKTQVSYPAAITKVFDAHGGYDKWSEMQELQFKLANGEHQLIDLHSRKVLVESEKRTIGFDGKDVWVVPDSLTTGARFYHNLYFYFYAMPFVLGDPGINYEEVGDKELFGMSLSGIKISYGDGVGDSPKDNYVLYFDKTSNTMKALMYTVTFKSQEASEKFNLIKYDEWQDVEGILLPKKLQWYNYKNDSVGEMRNEVIFSEVSLSKSKPDEKFFIKPEGAGIAEKQ
jgi:Fe-S cluster biosynthesis and repair protein YggX